jgi:hypothetical protein
MATRILQFTFVGYEGIEFPVAYYPTAQVDPVTLFIHTGKWSKVRKKLSSMLTWQFVMVPKQIEHL